MTRVARGIEPTRCPPVPQENLEDTVNLTEDSFPRTEGLEAKVAMFLGLVSQDVNRRSFPNGMPMDVFLMLLLPVPDTCLDAEEIRLVYDALTRAKTKVVIPTMLGGLLPFVDELKKEGESVKVFFRGKKAPLCPACSTDYLLDASNHQHQGRARHAIWASTSSERSAHSATTGILFWGCPNFGRSVPRSLFATT